MRRLLFHPVTSLILLLLLLGDAALLPKGGARGVSAAGWWIREHLWRFELLASQPARPPTLFLVRDPSRPDGFEVLVPDDESYDRPTKELRDRSAEVLVISYSPILHRTGWWAATQQLDRHELKMTFGENLTPAERATARRMFVERSGAGRWLSREDFETLAVEDIDRTRPLVLGYVHNCVSAACAVLFLISLAWLPRAPGWVRAWRERRALSEGRCPGCGYSIAGLPAGVCPECGRVVPRPG